MGSDLCKQCCMVSQFTKGRDVANSYTANAVLKHYLPVSHSTEITWYLKIFCRSTAKLSQAFSNMIPGSVNYELVLKREGELGMQLKPVVPALRRQTATLCRLAWATVCQKTTWMI